jgi:hypothetical protein
MRWRRTNKSATKMPFLGACSSRGMPHPALQATAHAPWAGAGRPRLTCSLRSRREVACKPRWCPFPRGGRKLRMRGGGCFLFLCAVCWVCGIVRCAGCDRRRAGGLWVCGCVLQECGGANCMACSNCVLRACSVYMCVGCWYWWQAAVDC